MKNHHTIFKGILLFFFIALLVYAYNFTGFGDAISTPEGRATIGTALTEFVNTFGAFAPLIHIFAYSLVTIFLFPGTIMTFIGAILFGTVNGTIFNIIGATIGASLCFLVARYLGHDFVAKLHGKKSMHKEATFSKKHGFSTVFIARLVPVVPFNVLNFGSGLTKISFKDYVSATFLGLIPGTFIYTYLFATLGESVLSGNFVAADLLTREILIPIGLFILLIVGGIVYKKHMKK